MEPAAGAAPRGVDAAALQAALRRCGLSQFRHGQLEAITATLEGRDSLLILPTGGGKSLTYQVSAAARSGSVARVDASPHGDACWPHACKCHARRVLMHLTCMRHAGPLGPRPAASAACMCTREKPRSSRAPRTAAAGREGQLLLSGDLTTAGARGRSGVLKCPAADAHWMPEHAPACQENPHAWAAGLQGSLQHPPAPPMQIPARRAPLRPAPCCAMSR